jgi:hypothetical protein
MVHSFRKGARTQRGSYLLAIPHDWLNKRKNKKKLTRLNENNNYKHEKL